MEKQCPAVDTDMMTTYTKTRIDGKTEKMVRADIYAVHLQLKMLCAGKQAVGVNWRAAACAYDDTSDVRSRCDGADAVQPLT